MKKHILLLLCLVMLLTSCGLSEAEGQGKHSDEETYAGSQPLEPIQKKDEAIDSQKQVFMIYMVGSDLESEAGMASRDIAEIVASDFNEEHMEVLICTGGTSYWWTEDVSNELCEVHRISGGSMERVYSMKNSNMAEADTLTEFLDYAYTNFQADYYSLVMWNHGGGAVLGFGADENYNYDTLSLEELDKAFQNTALVADGKRLEWIGFDACLMAMIEVADVLSGYADYMIASEETEIGEGWDYSCLKTLSDGEHFHGSQATKEIVEAYHTYYETNYKYTPDYALACLDLSRTKEVVSGWESLIDAAAKELHEGGYSKIAKLRDQTKTFGKVSSSGFYDTVDLYDLAGKMRKLYPQQAAVLQTALEDMVVHIETNVHGAHGVAVYFPYENKEYTQEWMKKYEATGFSEYYVAFLKSFTDTLSGEQLADWNSSEMALVENTEISGEYYVQLTEEQYANYSHAKYSIWEEEKPGEYICWINSYDVSVSEDGKISSGFEGKKFFIEDTSGNSIACCVTEIERNESYVKYAIPVFITPHNTDEEFYMQSAYIHFRVDEEHPEGEIIGIYKNLDTDSTLFPNRDVIKLQEGDVITPFYFAREIIFGEDGSVGPFNEWKQISGLGHGFAVKGDVTIILKDAEAGTEYYCLFGVTDTQGNSYFTNPLLVQY